MHDPVAVVRAFFDALLTAPDEAASLVADGAVLEEPKALPYGGRYDGPDGARRLGEKMQDAWHEVVLREEAAHDLGGGRVALVQHLEGRADDARVAAPRVALLEITDGEVAALRVSYFDAQAVADALRPAPSLFDTPTDNPIAVYTDGACSGNPGPGGWGALLLLPTGEERLAGGEASSTNNRMELTAALRALERLPEGATVHLYTDSRYLVNAFKQGWLKNWQRNGWKTASKKPVANQDLWKDLVREAEKRQVTWKWVKGHAGDPLNEQVDGMAVAAMQRYK